MNEPNEQDPQELFEYCHHCGRTCGGCCLDGPAWVTYLQVTTIFVWIACVVTTAFLLLQDPHE